MEDKNTQFPAIATSPIKLKDVSGRGGIFFNLVEVFGFLPEMIVIQKVVGKHDMFVLSAVLTSEELAKEQLIEKVSKLPKIAPTKRN